jgi:hypothetical protein
MTLISGSSCLAILMVVVILAPGFLYLGLIAIAVLFFLCPLLFAEVESRGYARRPKA